MNFTLNYDLGKSRAACRNCDAYLCQFTSWHRGHAFLQMRAKDSAIAGAVSGITARVITTPLDVIKIRFQLQLEPIRFSVSASC